MSCTLPKHAEGIDYDWLYVFKELLTHQLIEYILIFSHLGLSKEILKGPHFTSRPSTYSEKVGGTVTLICQVDNLGKSFSIKLWYW